MVMSDPCTVRQTQEHQVKATAAPNLIYNDEYIVVLNLGLESNEDNQCDFLSFSCVPFPPNVLSGSAKVPA